ncbi:MAG: heme-binding domain-containing protein [Planctomycetes bacterium]|nr:heme-binding domain-containing protein [Planctomycetota bacterium]
MKRSFPLAFLILLSLFATDLQAQRVRWETSKVVGSPDPQLPFTVQKTYAGIEWKSPIYALEEPGTDRLLVITQGGEQNRPSRILRIEDDPSVKESELLYELSGRLLYSLTFHPKHRENRQVFVFSNGPTGNPNRINRISRLMLNQAGNKVIEPLSGETIIEWPSSGHDGGDLLFGLDGMLYVTTGDGTSDSDVNLAAQDISNLNGAVLRIDVDHPGKDQPYSIPEDNPFVAVKNARGECWAFGLRNPWRMSMDPKTGRIWVGSNGQDLWESVNILRRGDNYGWSVYEGNHPFYLNRKLGPAPFVPPTMEHHHREARSLTGGVVYHGGKLPKLDGAYVYGDYATGKIWAGRHDGKKLTWHEEIADTSLKIVGFAVSPRGDLLVVDHGSGLYRIIPTPPTGKLLDFPRKLSETGIFSSVPGYKVAPGVVPYSVNSPGWMDGATAQRHLALPGDVTLPFGGNRGWELREGSVIIQTLSIGAHRIETRLMTRQNNEWAGYSYLWNKEQTEAELVGKKGLDIEVEADGKKQPWRIPGRAECMSCHSRADNFLLGITADQLNRDHGYKDGPAPQLQTLKKLGVLSGYKDQDPGPLANPYDEKQPLKARARSYLDTNCAPCHIEAGGGNSTIRLNSGQGLEKMMLVSAHPRHDTFGIPNALLIAPGAPERSILYQRISRRGRGQMPPLVTQKVDKAAARLFHDWISSLEPKRKFVKAWKTGDLLEAAGKLAPSGPQDKGKALYRELGCEQCHRIGKEGGGVGPNLGKTLASRTREQLIQSIIEPSREISEGFSATLVVTQKGRVVEGRVEREDDSGVEIRTSDFLSGPVRIEAADILERRPSKNSTMPTGLLDTLEKAEVLDLLRYLLSIAKTGSEPGK